MQGLPRRNDVVGYSSVMVSIPLRPRALFSIIDKGCTLRVMYLAQFYHPMSSASTINHEIVRRLAERGHYVELLVPSACFDECPRKCTLRCNKLKGISVRRLPVPTFSAFKGHVSIRVLTYTLAYLPLILYALIIARKKKLDLIIATYHVTHLAPFSAFLVSRIIKVPLVIKCHDVVFSEARRFLGGKIFSSFLGHLNSMALRHAKRVLVLSNELKFLMRESYKVKDENFFIFPNSVDTRMFRNSEDSSDIREKLGVQGNKIIMHVAPSLKVSYRKKGLEFLIQALPKVVAKEPSVVLVVLGLTIERTQREFESLASSLNIEKHVRFIKPVPYEDMPKYIAIADICIGPLCPSLDTYGSTPRKVLEYLACAKPVVACHGGVARDLVMDGYNGFLVRYGDLEALASRILKLVKNQKFARKLGLNARFHSLTFYDEKLLVDKLSNEILRI